MLVLARHSRHSSRLNETEIRRRLQIFVLLESGAESLVLGSTRSEDVPGSNERSSGNFFVQEFFSPALKSYLCVKIETNKNSTKQIQGEGDAP